MLEREWTAEDKDHFLHMVGHSALLSTESALHVLEFQQATDERIAAEKAFDRTFAPDQCRGVIPQDFFEQRFGETL